MDNPNAPPGSPRSSLSTLLLMTFFIFMLSNGGEDPEGHREMESILQSMKYQSSNYSAWLNNTESNFTLTPEPPTLSPLLQSILPEQGILDPETSSYYQNLTGFVNSDIRVYNLSEPVSTAWARFADPYSRTLNHSAAAQRTADWKWSDTTASFINLRETKSTISNETTFFRGTMDLSIKSTGDAARFALEGVHIVPLGSFHGFVEPIGVHPDIRQLSAFVPERFRNTTAYAVEAELRGRIKRFRALYESGAVPSHDSQDEEGPGKCAFIFRGQSRATNIPESYLRELEREWSQPSGVRTVDGPPVILDSVLVSKNCGILVRMDKGIVLRNDTFWRKTTTYSAIAFCVYLTLLVLVVKQMEWTSSPAMISKVSRWTFAIQAISDCYAFVAHITIGMMSNNRTSTSLIAPGFLAATLFLVFEVRYAALMHRIQGPEDAAAVAAPQPPPTPAAAAATAAARRLAREEAGEPLLPNTVPPPTRTPPEPSIFRRVASLLNDADSRSWIFVLLFLVFMIQLIVSSKLLIAAIFFLYSFWVPQIFRNVHKGTRKALRKRYVLGTSACRMYFVLYALACPDNVLFSEPSRWVWVIFAWVCIQIMVLLGQEYFGAGFLLPKSWEPVKAYDYHASIPLPDPESPDQAQALGDCSVCLEPIIAKLEAPVGSPTEKESTTALLQSLSARSYSLAPCHHMFHTACLERWLAVKSICPVCRRHLPPL